MGQAFDLQATSKAWNRSRVATRCESLTNRSTDSDRQPRCLCRPHFRSVLLHSRHAGGTDFICQSVPIDLFRNPAPSVLSTVNAQPITRADSSFSSLLSGVFGVHRLPASALRILASRCCGQMLAEVSMGGNAAGETGVMHGSVPAEAFGPAPRAYTACSADPRPRPTAHHARWRSRYIRMYI